MMPRLLAPLALIGLLVGCDSGSVAGCVGPLCFAGNNQSTCDDTGQCLCPSASALDLALPDALTTLRASARSCGSISEASASSLVWDATLDAAATAHADDMRQFGFTDPTGSDGLDVSNRVAAEAAASFRYDTTLHQLVTDGKSSLSDALDAWVATPAACSALMSRDVSHAGLACAGNTSGRANVVNRWSLVLGGE